MSASNKSISDRNVLPCEICGKVIARKADVPRHNRTHATNKAKLMHYCPFEGCDYGNLQKSNVTTHARTHTGEKPLSCPDCTFTTADPGSLTRHKKRTHGYEPKKRAQGSTGKAPTTKSSNRHAPYARGPSAAPSSSSSSDASSSSNSSSDASSSSNSSRPFLDAELFDLAYYSPRAFQTAVVLTDDKADATCDIFMFDEAYSYPWQKECSIEELEQAIKATMIPVVPQEPSPKQLYPAVDAGYTLEGLIAEELGYLESSFNAEVNAAPSAQVFQQPLETPEPIAATEYIPENTSVNWDEFFGMNMQPEASFYPNLSDMGEGSSVFTTPSPYSDSYSPCSSMSSPYYSSESSFTPPLSVSPHQLHFLPPY